MLYEIFRKSKYMNSEGNIQLSEIDKIQSKSPCFRKFFTANSRKSRHSASKNIFQKECVRTSFSKIDFSKPSEKSIQMFTIDLDLDSSREEGEIISKKTPLKKRRFHRKQQSMCPLTNYQALTIHKTKDSIEQNFRILKIKQRFKARQLIIVEEKITKMKMIMKMTFKIEYKVDSIKKGDDELENYTKIDHPSILKVHTVYQESNKYFLLFDFIEGVTLTQFIKEFDLTENIGKNIIKQLLQALDYLHGQEIVHGDIRPENIYVTNYQDNLENLKIKIIDLSLSQSTHKFRENKTNSCGLSSYAPPQIFMGVINSKYDIWSVGILAIVLFSHFEEIEESESFEEFLESIAERGDSFKEHIKNIPEKVIQFINFLLIKKHTQRPSAAQALRHSWISSNDQSTIASFKSRRIVDLDPYIST